jgi:hypothetical protein
MGDDWKVAEFPHPIRTELDRETILVRSKVENRKR